MSNIRTQASPGSLKLRGEGKAENPWKLSSKEDLLELQSTVNNGADCAGQYFILEDDIELSAADNWVGLGKPVVKQAATHSPYVSGGTGFAGVLDGDGHYILIHRTTNAPGEGVEQVAGGLVNYLTREGKVCNLTMVGTLTATGAMDAVGGVVGYNSGTIEHVTNYVVVTAISSFNVGGVAGFNNGYYKAENADGSSGDAPAGSIQHCMNHGSILGCRKVGGITGEDAGMIAECGNLSNITGDYSGKDGVGGIAGRTGDNDDMLETGVIENCYNFGDVTDAGGAWIGGLTGFENKRSSILVGYNLGSVKGYSYRDNTAGYNNNGTIKDTYGPESGEPNPSMPVFQSNGAQHYDGTILMYETAMRSQLLGALNASDQQQDLPQDWVMGANGFPTLKDCGNTGCVIELNGEFHVVNVVAYPSTLTYVEGEKFSLDGLVIQAIYDDGRRVTVDLSDPQVEVTVTPGGEMKIGTHTVQVTGYYGNMQFDFTFKVEVDEPNSSSTVVLCPGETGCWGTLQGALEAVSDTDPTVYVAGTTALGSGTYGKATEVTVKRQDGFTDVMFTVANGTDYSTGSDPDAAGREIPAVPANVVDVVTLKNMTVDGTDSSGKSAAPMIRVYSGDVTLESSVTLSNNKIPAWVDQDKDEDHGEDYVPNKDKDYFQNDAQRGAGMSIQGGKIDIQGSIEKCETVEGGGLVISGGAVTLTNTISDCKATRGSAVYLLSGTLTVGSGGSISGNGGETCEKGTVYVCYSEAAKQAAQLILDGGEISGNKAGEGSIAYIEGGNLTYKGGTLSGSGNAIYVGNMTIKKLEKTEIIHGTLTIANAAFGIGDGGSVYLEDGCYINLNITGVLSNTINVIVPEGTAIGTVIAVCASSGAAQSNWTKITINGLTDKVKRDGSNLVLKA